jgi:class 3 adenylate cyclase
MGLCLSTKNALEYTILCDNAGIIRSVTDPLLQRLNYNAKTLEGEFIGILMNDFMSMLHKQYFINTFHKSEGVQRNRLENKMKALHSKRSLIIYDIDGAAHNVEVSIEHRDTNFIITFSFITAGDALLYSKIPTDKDLPFKLNKSDAVIIKIDFVNSTDLLNNKGVVALIDTSVRFHRTVLELIRSKYYPFIYLHEVIGDSFVLVLNTDWTYNSEKFCASLAINYIYDLVHATRNFVKIRTGVGYGQLYYGTVGTTFNFFGFPLNIAARLEAICVENEINICEKLYNKLSDELNVFRISERICKKNAALLKGFGQTVYYSIPVSIDKPYLVYTTESKSPHPS